MNKEDNVGFNPNKFMNGSTTEKDHLVKNMPVIAETKPTAKVKPTKKKTTKAEVVDVVPQTSMSYIQENIPYATAYNETNMQLDAAIHQLDMLTGEVLGDIQALRSNKTIRNKYNYINDATANAASIINSKIGAIKEKNKTINDINHMELTRMKEMKSTMDQEDDNQKLMNMYNAFVNTPIGGGLSTFGAPKQQEFTLNNNIPTVALGNPVGNGNWQPTDPAQNRMLLQAQGRIETVVMFDPSNGNRWFEVIDKNTGQPVPNVEKPSAESVFELDVNVRGGFAKDSNRNISYRLITVNPGTVPMSEF